MIKVRNGAVSLYALMPLVLGVFGSRALVVSFHDAVHLLSLVFSIFLLVVAIHAYLQDGRRQFFFLMTAFGVLAANQALTFLSSSYMLLREPMIPVINDPISHWLDVLMISLLIGGLLVREGDDERLRRV
ncbi:MAG: hypothetical protein NXY59_06160 [Aigarchaeota archaeon]|nr:hypothetical protein [Candidatus Pelearchaeum maunauluense]